MLPVAIDAMGGDHAPEAIVAGAEARGAERLDATDFEAVTGKGVTGMVAGRAVALGNAALMTDLGCSLLQGFLIGRGDSLAEA